MSLTTNHSLTFGNLLGINQSQCSMGVNIGTSGVRNTFFGANAGKEANEETSDVVSIGTNSDMLNGVTKAVAIGYSATVDNGATNAVALGAAAQSKSDNTFVIGSVQHPLIPVTHYYPFTHFRKVYTYTTSHDFTSDPEGAEALISGNIIFLISSAYGASVTLPTSSQCLSKLRDYVPGSYVYGYIVNDINSEGSLTILHPTGTNYYPSSTRTIEPKNGFRCVILYNGTGIDYIM